MHLAKTYMVILVAKDMAIPNHWIRDIVKANYLLCRMLEILHYDLLMYD